MKCFCFVFVAFVGFFVEFCFFFFGGFFLMTRQLLMIMTWQLCFHIFITIPQSMYQKFKST